MQVVLIRFVTCLGKAWCHGLQSLWQHLASSPCAMACVAAREPVLCC